ncbi:protein of unknown function DUF3449 [Macleaya cordata]|uniref:Splicing factor SF3a60 /Prp9 subunit C-terminal domain-containing protein n=1 Tax=Macleaya cordata TaxID=56857 RepID=A0A200QD97_MACCD|nr:protein of unknown function DUF3449 [Macleaya cordata]
MMISLSLVEATRVSHEQLDQLERVIVKDLRTQSGSKFEVFNQKHRLRHMIDSIITITEKLIQIYQDRDNKMKDEIDALEEEETARGTFTFNVFFNRLQDIREYYRQQQQQHPNANQVLLADASSSSSENKYDAEEPHIGIAFSGEERYGEIALKEAKIRRLCELLDEKILQTKEYVEKKQALTYEEMEAERDEEEEEVLLQVNDTESDQEEQHQIYNPLKLPMGWDGKPIPYWLYKLHGLGQEFKCEICGNYSYWGRRDFERHFREGRHQRGMFCLGIPNNKNFNEITSIKEAKLLWERIQERRGVKRWRPDLEEEFEDNEGNIYNKKAYTDLRRQGLI